MPSSPATWHVVALAGTALGVGIAAPMSLAQERVPSVFELTGSFASSEVRESSGVAVSRRHAGVLWTHNDSGDDAIVFAVTLGGKVLGRHRVTGATAQDWEDLALGRCPNLRGDCLYIADTGDNEERRPLVTIYIVPEPEPIAARSGARAAAAVWAVSVAYPDGPHDVEAIWVNPDGALELVTKGLSGPIRRYRVAREALKNSMVRAQAVDTLPFMPERLLGRYVTGGAISPNGKRVALRTYTEIFLFHRGADGQLEPDGQPCWLGTREPQGEAVDFLDDDTLVLTSESFLGRHGTIHRVRC